MRFRGGGVGHMYMRQVEPWLDATGWGTTWPSLQNREPEPAQAAPMHSGDSARPAPESRQSGGGDGGSGDEDSEDDKDPGEMDDGDGEDLEQPEEDEDYDSEEDPGRGGDRPTHSSYVVHKGRGDETEEEEEEGHNL